MKTSNFELPVREARRKVPRCNSRENHDYQTKAMKGFIYHSREITEGNVPSKVKVSNYELPVSRKGNAVIPQKAK